MQRRARHTISDGRGASVPVLDVRAGDLLVGNLYELSGMGTPRADDFVAKLYWLPIDAAVAKTEALDIDVESAFGQSVPTRHLRVGGDGNDSGVAGDYFWPSGTPLPGREPLRVTATSRDHWGCILVTPG